MQALEQVHYFQKQLNKHQKIFDEAKTQYPSVKRELAELESKLSFLQKIFGSKKYKRLSNNFEELLKTLKTSEKVIKKTKYKQRQALRNHLKGKDSEYRLLYSQTQKALSGPIEFIATGTSLNGTVARGYAGRIYNESYIMCDRSDFIYNSNAPNRIFGFKGKINPYGEIELKTSDHKFHVEVGFDKIYTKFVGQIDEQGFVHVKADKTSSDIGLGNRSITRIQAKFSPSRKERYSKAINALIQYENDFLKSIS